MKNILDKVKTIQQKEQNNIIQPAKALNNIGVMRYIRARDNSYQRYSIDDYLYQLDAFRQNTKNEALFLKATQMMIDTQFKIESLTKGDKPREVNLGWTTVEASQVNENTHNS